MGRNIVLCFDGTNNEYASTNTNVVKPMGMLDRSANDQTYLLSARHRDLSTSRRLGKLKKWFHHPARSGDCLAA